MSIASVSTAGSSVAAAPANNSSAIAALEKQLVSLQKEVAQASAAGATATSAQLVQTLSQEIVVVEAQIAQLQQQSSTPTATVAVKNDKPASGSSATQEADRQARAKKNAMEMQSPVGTQIDVYA